MSMSADLSAAESGPVEVSGFTSLENIEVELGTLQGTAGRIDKAVAGTSKQTTNVETIATTSTTAADGIVRVVQSGIVLPRGAVQHERGADMRVLANNQQVLLVNSPQSQTVLKGEAAHAGSMSCQTKVLITKNSSTGQSLIMPATSKTLASAPQTQPKDIYRVVMSNTGVYSPQKGVAVPSSPTKQIRPAGKVPISPLKTPPKVTMVPVARSPQKGKPQIITMMGKSLVSGIGSSAAVSVTKPQTFTLSPSKVIIKGQPVSVVSCVEFLNQQCVILIITSFISSMLVKLHY